jgi:FkbM family methyltransferase
MIKKIGNFECHLRDDESFDARIFDEVVRDNIYRIGQATMPKSGTFTMIDAGAHIGIASLFVASVADQLGLDFRIYSMEPLRKNFEMLRENIERNGLESKITAIPFALAPFTGPAKLMQNKENSGGSAMRPDGDTDIDTKRMEDIADEFGIKRADLLKLDIEGMEYANILSWSDETLGIFDQIVAEIHGFVIRSEGLGFYQSFIEKLNRQFDVEVLGTPMDGGNIYGKKRTATAATD